jgi:general secretion pathway protein N
LSRWSWIALGAGAYLAFLLAAFPAGTALRWFAPPGMVSVGVEGTVWNGRAATVSLGGLAVEQPRWRLRPAALLLGRIGATVEGRIADGFASGDVEATPSRVIFRNLRGAASLPSLPAFLPLRGIRGQASLALESLELVDGWPTEVVGEVKVASLEVTPFIPASGGGGMLALGDYTITFAPAPERAISALVVDNGGPLEVSGSVQLDATRSYTLDALVKPRPGAAQQLVDGLAIMTAEPDAEGRRRLTLTGSL